jgi:hypothetical protein
MIPGINQPEKNNTMVEPFARSSGMAIANQLTPPLGAYAEGADQGQCCGILYYCANQPRKKLSSELNNFILIFINYQCPTPPKQWKQPPCTLPPGRTAS